MAVKNFDVTIESSLPVVQQNGLNTKKDANFEGALALTGAATLSGALNVTGLATFSGGANTIGASIRTYTPVAVNATATLTAAQVAAGYITSTSAAAVTMTLPTGTLLGAAVNAVQGTVLELYIDNTAGANTVTLAVATNGIKSDAANTTTASFGQLTVASGATGIGRFTLMFSSATAYVFTRTA